MAFEGRDGWPITRPFARWFLALLSGATVAASVTLAAATEAPPPVDDAVQPARVEHSRLSFGVDATTHHSLAGYTDGLYAPFGMNRSGLRLSAFSLYGGYAYRSKETTFEGRWVSADVLAGYGHVFGNGAVTIAAGGNFQDHRLRPDDPDNPVRGSRAGVKVQSDAWVNPTSRTVLFGLASYATTFHTYYAIGRAGYDFTGHDVFLGPEVTVLGNERTDQWRAGVHLGEIRIGRARLTLSGGFMRERGEGSGAYGTAHLEFGF